MTNLGRYWPSTGPQITLYTPSPFISKSSKNYVVLVEFEGSSCQTESECSVEFIDTPNIDSIPNKAQSFNENLFVIGK